MKLKPAIALLAAMVMAPGLAAADEKADKCEAAPTHACVLDLMWDAMPRVTDNFQAETKRAFIDAALLTGDKVLIDLYKERTGWSSPDALTPSLIKIARRKGDKAALTTYGDQAINGLRYDWYQLYDIAAGLAETGDVARARKVTDRLPHGPDDSVTTLNMHTDLQALIRFHDTAPVTLRGWADRRVANDGWFEGADDTWLKAAAKRAGNLATFPQEVQQRFGSDAWKYLYALIRLAPEMTAGGGEAAVNLFRGYIEGWVDPRQENVAVHALMLAARTHPDVRAAMLAAFDARQPTPSPRVATLRALFNTFDAPLDRKGKAVTGLIGGSYEQSGAALALATFNQEQFLAAAKKGEGSFSMSRPGVLREALKQVEDKSFALAIANLMAELGEPRTIDGYDYARYATEWARDNCNKTLFDLASSRLARPDEMEVFMWQARFTGEAATIAKYLNIGNDRIQSDMESALRGYEHIIAGGYCKAGQ